VSFWCSLFLAAGLFAVLSLAPKWRTYRDLSHEYDRLERQLVSTERRTERLARVADALEHDPVFAAELARANFDGAGEEQRIPVGPQLSLSSWDSVPTITTNRPSPLTLLDGPLLKTLSDDRGVRLRMMAASAFLVVVAFALCGEKSPHRGNGGDSSRGTIRSWLAHRYRRAPAREPGL
jgi:hypothetical protein